MAFYSYGAKKEFNIPGLQKLVVLLKEFSLNISHSVFFCPFNCVLCFGVERVGIYSAESENVATFADSSCSVSLSALVLALSAKIIQKVTIYLGRGFFPRRIP